MIVTHLEATCENGHRQVIRIEGYTQEQAEFLAGLLDGTSPAYVYPPGEDSPIGKCGICGKQIEATIIGAENAP